MRAISSWGLALLGLTSSYAGFDWLMSLDPHWASTIYGVYFWAASLVSSLAALILLTMALRGSGRTGRAVTVEHLHDLGKLLFGFVVFWTYIAFAQYFLIWCANFPEESRWYIMPPLWLVEHALLGSLLRALRGPVLPASFPADPARPVLAGLSCGLGAGLPLCRSLLADHARTQSRRGPAGLAGCFFADLPGAGVLCDHHPSLPIASHHTDRRPSSVRVDRFPEFLRSGSHDIRSNRSLSTEPG